MLVVRRLAAVAVVMAGIAMPARAASGSGAEIVAKPAELKAAWGDQGNGTYVNPVLPSDYSDLDAIRVGDDFYAMSSTFQFSPGAVILHSKDLVSWTVFSHAVGDVTQIAPEMNWDKMDRYGHGIWAGAIRFHAGKFWVYFGTPEEGVFVTTAKDAAGPWEPVHAVLKAKGWDDCCPFWDDDGQGYLVCTNYADKYKIHLFKMSADGRQLVMGSDKVIHQSRGSEANKLYKIKGLYYHYYSEVQREGRVVMMERSKSLDGPWESRQLIHVNKALDKEPNQGGLIELASGDWWFVTHQGTGDWEGRAMVLLPVTWVEGWPVIGKVGADGIGNMMWTAKKPVVSSGGAAGGAVAVGLVPQTDDEFEAKSLPAQWEWNYQPRGEMVAVGAAGFFAAACVAPLQPNDLLKAGNTLTQRCLRTETNEVTLKLDISGMADGEQAGLCHFAKGYSTVGISQSGETRTLTFNEGGKVTAGPVIASKNVWLRSTWGYDGISQYAYSIDGKKFTPFGQPYALTWGYYRGDRIGIFNYNNKGDRGFVDVDSFHYTFAKPAGASR